MDGWEKQGIPVSRLSSLDCALNIVEELNRLEEASDKEAMRAGMPTSGAMGPWGAHGMKFDGDNYWL